ncbi:hypothetical protein BS47DRAFT_1367995 [Hydnum rufescens UP504]|uniref:Uncharacterized protein n=1 Tax=Hydnum rufescens UP504 TaxID=1448309 RepID=A0A9P6DPD6_9AGAM|nr:hypothetical protein BS47DRAFT_1367995 [Hydnum rufescens UP504]
MTALAIRLHNGTSGTGYAKRGRGGGCADTQKQCFQDPHATQGALGGAGGGGGPWGVGRTGGFYNGKMAAPHPSLYWGVVTAPGLLVDGGGGVVRNENFLAIAGKLNLGLNAGNCPVSKASHLLL